MEHERPTFDQVNLVVANMPATLEFYRRLGVEIADPPAEAADRHRSTSGNGGINIDFDSVDFAKVWDQGWQGDAADASGVVLGFRLSSREAVDKLYADLTGAGYRAQQAPYDAFWGARYAIIEDPDGNAVGLMSPADPGRRSPIPVTDAEPATSVAGLPSGAEVLDNRGAKFAHIGEVSGDFFRLKIPLGADFWLPTAYVASVDGEHVHLSISRDDVDQYKLSSPSSDDIINDI
ncbi:MAG: VOC family protein [Tepidiformaceae bacterium]